MKAILAIGMLERMFRKIYEVKFAVVPVALQISQLVILT
jgi:hypothetical protein